MGKGSRFSQVINGHHIHGIILQQLPVGNPSDPAKTINRDPDLLHINRTFNRSVIP